MLYLVPFLPPLQMCHPTTPPQVLVLPFREMCPRIQLCRAPSCCTRRWGPATRCREKKTSPWRGHGVCSLAWSETQHAAVLPVREPPVSFVICHFEIFSAEMSRIIVFFISFTAEEAIHHTIAESRVLRRADCSLIKHGHTCTYTISGSTRIK